MKIDTSQGDIQTFGDIKEFKTSIDPRNLEFITTLLSSNLYSDPEQSFIREIVSNAWDSHVEAGKTDIPVLVKLNNTPTRETRSITIRDYGTGLSPERFKEVYCNIGSSTKRDTNEYIGGFGIGKYSSLACSNVVYITSYYEGKAYYYVMVKSGNSITTNLMQEISTTEENGVEITIKGIATLDPYYKALSCITFFPNVYVDGYYQFNDTKVKYFNKFAVASEKMQAKILLGKVLYPLNTTFVDPGIRGFVNNILDTGIVVKFDIGELDITPNRENIIYNNATISIINKRFKEASDEIESYLKTKFQSVDYQDIIEYFDAVKSSTYYDFIEDVDKFYFIRGFRISSEYKKGLVTYRGTKLADLVDTMSVFLNMKLPNLKGVVSDDKIYSSKIPLKCERGTSLRADKILICQTGTRMTKAVSTYLKDNYCGYTVLTPFTLFEFRTYVFDTYKNSIRCPSCAMIDATYRHIMETAKTIDFTTNKDFLQFKEEISVDKTKGIKVEKATIHLIDPKYSRKETLNFKSLVETVSYVRKLKRGVILVCMEADEKYWRDIAGARRFVVIKARKDMFSALRALNLSCLVDTDWLLKRDPKIIKLATLIREFPTEMAIPNKLIATLPKEEATEILQLNNWYKNMSSFSYYYMVAKTVNLTDEHVSSICKKLKKYNEIDANIKELTTRVSYIIDQEFYGLIAMKTKAYKICPDLYQKIRNNKLFRILCNKK